jgi:hypothetical protein
MASSMPLSAAASSGQKSKVYALADRIEVLHALLRIGAERKLIAPRFVGRPRRAVGRSLHHDGREALPQLNHGK